MPFSNLFAVLLFIGVVPVMAGAFMGWALYVFIIYNVLLLVLLAVDFIITPRPRALEVVRLCDDKLSLGTGNEIRISVRNNSGYFLDVELRDQIPPYFTVSSHSVRLKAVPHQDSEAAYSVVPEKRGEFPFGSIYARYRGVLRLCMKQGRFAAEKSYKVYPNLKDLRRYSFAALKKSDLVYGAKKTRTYGVGTEFESLREYGEGDDYRKINWMATARAGKLIVSTFEPEKNQHVFILLDSSRVMNSEINYIKKLDYAINSAFLLAEVASKKGDNVGLMVFDSSVKRFVKPGKGPSHFQLLAENLYNVEENFVTADYRGALSYLNEYQKRRSLLCIFTELFNADEALMLVSNLKSIARSHIPLVITINDTRLYDYAEGGVREVNDIFLKSAAIKLVEERERIKGIFRDSGVVCLDVPPDRLSMEVVNKYLNMKATMRI